MTGTQRLLAIAISFLLTGFANSATPDVVGIVVQASHANLGGHTASQGTTVYDGDRLSTEAEGTLQLSSGKVALFLPEASSAIVHRDTDGGEKGLKAELVFGTLTLTMDTGTAAEVVARSARIRPGDNQACVVQVRVVGERELIVSARRGTAVFSYRDLSEPIPEGKSYRVVLDPAEDGTPTGQTTKKPNRRGKAFILIAVAGAAAATGIAIWKTRNAVESPDHP